MCCCSCCGRNVTPSFLHSPSWTCPSMQRWLVTCVFVMNIKWPLRESVSLNALVSSSRHQARHHHSITSGSSFASRFAHLEHPVLPRNCFLVNHVVPSYTRHCLTDATVPAPSSAPLHTIRRHASAQGRTVPSVKPDKASCPSHRNESQRLQSCSSRRRG